MGVQADGDGGPMVRGGPMGRGQGSHGTGCNVQSSTNCSSDSPPHGKGSVPAPESEGTTIVLGHTNKPDDAHHNSQREPESEIRDECRSPLGDPHWRLPADNGSREVT